MNANERKQRAVKKVAEVAKKKGTRINYRALSGESLQAIASLGQKHKGKVSQAKAELRQRQKESGDISKTRPTPKEKKKEKWSLNTMVAKLFGE